MTVITLRDGTYVCSRFTGSRGAVMTGFAGARCNRIVIEHGRRPGTRGMAVIAGIAGRQMRGGFALGRAVVVAAIAGAEYIEMVDADHG